MHDQDFEDFCAVIETLRYAKEMWGLADAETQSTWLRWCEWRMREIRRRISHAR
jgi:hypothetical protein